MAIFSDFADLSQGSTGDAVMQLQNDLMDIGYPMTADGSFGPITTQAVKDFQSARGLSVDGIAGPQTLADLAAAKASGWQIPFDAINLPAVYSPPLPGGSAMPAPAVTVMPPMTITAPAASAPAPSAAASTAPAPTSTKMVAAAGMIGIGAFLLWKEQQKGGRKGRGRGKQRRRR